jgi:membrane protein DedA with SNARE-associated domain
MIRGGDSVPSAVFMLPNLVAAVSWNAGFFLVNFLFFVIYNIPHNQ